METMQPSYQGIKTSFSKRILFLMTMDRYKPGAEIFTSIDYVERQDVKIFASIITDFPNLKVIQLWSDACNLQQ